MNPQVHYHTGYEVPRVEITGLPAEVRSKISAAVKESFPRVILYSDAVTRFTMLGITPADVAESQQIHSFCEAWLSAHSIAPAEIWADAPAALDRAMQVRVEAQDTFFTQTAATACHYLLESRKAFCALAIDLRKTGCAEASAVAGEIADLMFSAESLAHLKLVRMRDDERRSAVPSPAPPEGTAARLAASPARPAYKSDQEVAAAVARVLECLNGFPVSQARYILRDKAPQILDAGHLVATDSDRHRQIISAVGGSPADSGQ